MPAYNNTITILASAARAASVNGDDCYNWACKGVVVFFNISAVVGDDTMQLTVQGKDPVSGTYYQLLQSAALATTGLRVYEIHPSVAAASGGVTAVANRLVPFVWRAILTYATVGGVSDTLTCSVAAVLID